MNRASPLPHPLKKNDLIGVIAPAGQLQEPELFEKGVRILKEMGFRVKFARDLWPGKAYLANTDERRAGEINDFYKDPEVRGLVALRGGYGCLRILDMIDLNLIAKNPKTLIGYSDITILQNFLFEKICQVSFHGPVVTSLPTVDKMSRLSFYNSLMGHWKKNFVNIKIEILRDGPSFSGPLVGGNLSSLVTLLGTQYDFSWKDKIIFLEDINEPIYKVDRMFTQLHLAGKLKEPGGLILGDFSHSAHQDDIERLRYKESVWARVVELTEKTMLPIWAQFPSGHCSRNLTFPIGAKFEMSHEKAQLIPQ